MSRITGTDAKEMMEAYAAVYAPQELTEEQVWEEVENWVNSLLEEGYDLSDYTWEEMYESYLSEAPAVPSVPSMDQMVKKGLENQKLNQAFSRSSTQLLGQPGQKPPATTSAPRRDVVVQAAKGGVPGTLNKTTGKWTASASSTPAARTSAPTATPAARTPAGTPPGGKVAPTKPAATAQTGDKAKDMATFAKANPALAAAAAERARTRGTSATTNPLMKDMKSRLPAPAAPKVAPSNTLSNTVAAASKPAAFSPAPEVKATNTIAAAPKLAPVSPRQARLNMEEYDAYDLVLEYLLSQGHAETVEEAHYVMLEMDADTIGTIVEAAAEQSDKQIDKGVKTTYKAQNVIDNQHQGRSRGLNRLPANERAAKSKRMSGRLKARRDDLFGERNKREDSKRAELKKMLGL